MKKETKQDIVKRLQEGLNAQQRSVPQLPAQAHAKKIKALGSKTDPKHPFSGYMVGADESADNNDQPLNELSPETLVSYKKKAGAAASAADKAGDYAKGHKRFKGIVKATNKEFEKSAKSGVAEADKHSFIGKIQRGHELKKKVDATYPEIGIAQRAGDHAAAGKAFRKHERYANLERPGTWTKVKDEGVAEGVTSPEIKQAYDAIMNTTPKTPERKRAIAHYQKLRADAMAKKKQQDVAEGSKTSADIDKQIEFHKKGQAAAQYKGSMNKMHAKKIKDLVAKRDALKKDIKEEIANEDVLSALKTKLGDLLLQTLGKQAIDGDLKDKPNSQDDKEINPIIKKIKTDDGHEICIHGNEDDGFRISVKNKQAPSKFDTLDEAVMACEMYCAHRRNNLSNRDYVDEA